MRKMLVQSKNGLVHFQDELVINFQNETGPPARGPSRGMRGDTTNLYGDCTGLWGDCSGLWGDCSGIRGCCTGVVGCCTGVVGNLDNCEMVAADREKSVGLSDLTIADDPPAGVERS